ncbi:anti-sigma-I factor RsgI family protein [Collinsella ihumii]|uniref:anti-sigma-I factor RsgI family protein n=1 Tax=Collinsella ihumii TaxID=1720204 RepID=UPI0025AA3394|nr:hypothetical protein [Collinsella ihumii]MDN0054649.1 hypothetical protein [Collinsella ihumii]
MTDKLERRVRGAFDGAHMPTGLAERTLARIEAERAHQADDADGTGSGSATEAPSLHIVAGAAGTHARTRRRHVPLVAALAACLVLATLGIGGVAWASQPYAYVAIDVNPSIELGINRFDRVASTRAYNDDGEQLLAAAQVEGMPYQDAMDALEDELQAYIADGATVQMTVTCDDESQAAALESVGTRCLDSAGTGQVSCAHASEEEHHEAELAGMGIGKYRVWQELVDSGVDIPVDEASTMTMRELLDCADAEDVDISSTAGGCSDAGHRHGDSEESQSAYTAESGAGHHGGRRRGR